jgi:hypothetical protein
MVPPTPEAAVRDFLRRVRRRYLTRELLAVCGISAGASLLLEYGTGFANRAFGLALPLVSTGLALLLVAGALSVRRNRTAPVAVRADAALVLKDRLATFLDFAGRADIDEAFRRA